MDETKKIHELKIDDDFKTLIRPLQPGEYQQLEDNIVKDGCRDAITTWNGYIVDGHNRYEICHRHSIPFAVYEIDFTCKDEALVWICANQLGRRNLTDEVRRYLIGTKFESEKKLIKNMYGNNQYLKSTLKPIGSAGTARKIGLEENISHTSVEKYGDYSRAINKLKEKTPEIVPQILSGQYKLSHNNTVALSKMKPEEIKIITDRLKSQDRRYIPFRAAKSIIDEESESTGTVKDMPAFDPDSEITGLTLTIPSWESSIERVMNCTDFNVASQKAKEKLCSVLDSLVITAQEMKKRANDATKQ